MLIDARTIPNNYTLETDVCVIGAGAAGITLGLEFLAQPFRVCLLESGGLEFDEATQSLYQGKNIGLPYFPLHIARLRYFGGTTNHWGGVCVPFQQIDFESREWIRYSGWPFGSSAIDPFYKRTLSMFQLRSADFDAVSGSDPDKPALPLSSDHVSMPIAQRPNDKFLRFGRRYRDTVIRASNITCCLGANVNHLETDRTGKRVTRVHISCLTGNRFSVKARIFILAAGCIENARLLLLSNSRQPAGLGNQNGLVGRFFLEHPTFLGAVFRPLDRRIPVDFYRWHKIKDTMTAAGLSLSERVLRREKLVNVGVGLSPVYDEVYMRALESKGVASLRYLFETLRKRDTPSEFGEHLSNVIGDIEHVAAATYGKARFRGNYPIDHIKLVATIDPAPNPESRVILGTDRDQLGQRRIHLDWRLSPIDKHSARRTLEIIAIELGRAGLGRVQINISDDDTTWPEDMVGVSHHMGTTRMNDDPKQGVVDKNCRVHGIANLFVAGSSVFPTAGSGTPTPLIIALAIRLADHIKSRMR